MESNLTITFNCDHEYLTINEIEAILDLMYDIQTIKDNYNKHINYIIGKCYKNIKNRCCIFKRNNVIIHYMFIEKYNLISISKIETIKSR